MKLVILLLLAAILMGEGSDTHVDFRQAQKRYPITENGLWGWIDDSGEVVVAPRFRSIGQFSEGLAPARLEGTYGFVDEDGIFAIEPKFDMAHSFVRGMAKVYIHGKPHFIDKMGRQLFEHHYTEIDEFGVENYAIATTKTGKYGVVNRFGELIADTVYSKINPFSSGVAVVFGLNHKPYPVGDSAEPIIETGAINAEGELVIPFGKYKKVFEFKNNFAKVDLDVERQSGYYDRRGVVDSKGQLMFIVPAKKWRFEYGKGNFSEKLAIVNIYSVDPDTVKSWSGKKYSYKGVINPRGEIVFGNEKWEYITPFKRNRAFVRDVYDDWYIINRKGQTLNRRPYREVLFDEYSGKYEHLFQHGIQVVRTTEGWGAIDSNGQFIIKPRYLGSDYDRLYWRGSRVFIKRDIRVLDDGKPTRYGFWDLTTNTVVEPQFEDISFTPEANLICVYTGGLGGYVDANGSFLWQEKAKGRTPGILNIDYMNRNSYYASSPYKKELAGFGGWGTSKNGFKMLPSLNGFEKEILSLVAKPGRNAEYLGKYAGMKLYLVNRTQDTFYFDAQDSRLYLTLQAQDHNGKWKDIEYSPNSWCGNSYHHLFLPQNHYWEFVAPRFNGDYETQLRAKLIYKRRLDMEAEILYSNEFSGTINPGQFWRRRPYVSSGLMDPYNE